jgi:hypothetical protein|nr:RagB/SusD family nutrient uptake outer membrane protein [uncultured Sediminibacterium sp.]
MKSIKLLSFIFLAFTSCSKILEIDNPNTQLVGSSVFENDATATGALVAIYSQMENDGYISSIVQLTGLSSDEFINYNNTSGAMDLAFNNLTSENAITSRFWSDSYKFIYQANAVIEALQKSRNVRSVVKEKLTSEAKFIRAFCHFYLVNLFAEVPIANSTDYRVNSTISRSSINKVYEFIIGDLTDASIYLNDDYLNGNNAISTERVRPNLSAVNALLAKVYLYIGDYSKAEETATKIISKSSTYSLLTDLNSVYLKNSKEAIWQLMVTAPLRNSRIGFDLILTSSPSSVSLRPSIVNEFENSDKRVNSWINSITIGSQRYYFPFKYKIGQNATSVVEYTMIFRLSEMYLIRSEARGRQSNLLGAYQDLNAIRLRAGLIPLVPTTLTDLLNQVNKERYLELFAELGDRWLNLKRSNSINQVMTSVKGSNWATTDQLYPIPLQEILRNASLTQNPGY